jgi:hypothetical protein
MREHIATVTSQPVYRQAHEHSRTRSASKRRPAVTIMIIARSLLLFGVAALTEIGGAWLIWQGWREHRGLGWIAAGVLVLGAYGFIAAFSPPRTLAVCWPPTAESLWRARWPGA